MGELREVNLELGKPTAAAAMERLDYEIRHGRVLKLSVLKIIHGYGSTGAGGRIRKDARRYLEALKKQRSIRDFIPGEQFSIFNAETLAAFQRCDALRRDSDLERHNNGVTFILF